MEPTLSSIAMALENVRNKGLLPIAVALTNQDWANFHLRQGMSDPRKMNGIVRTEIMGVVLTPGLVSGIVVEA
jgi:hypothetical protein